MPSKKKQKVVTKYRYPKCPLKSDWVREFLNDLNNSQRAMGEKLETYTRLLIQIDDDMRWIRNRMNFGDSIDFKRQMSKEEKSKLK